jgi:DNA topoisomerase-1
VRENKRLSPTETGILVNDLITEHFANIVNVEFTAHMEEDLDKIASGNEEWVNTIREFYTPFAIQVEEAEQKMPEMKTGPEPIGRLCPECGKELVIRWGRYGKLFRSVPDCRHTEAWRRNWRFAPRRWGYRRTEDLKGRIFYGC